MPDPVDRADLLRELIVDALGERDSALAGDDNLMELGVDSVRVMKIAGLLRRQGIRVKFVDMMSRPTVDAWLELATDQKRVEPS